MPRLLLELGLLQLRLRQLGIPLVGPPRRALQQPCSGPTRGPSTTNET